MNQLGERLGVESEFLRRDGGQEFRAGFESWIVEFLARAVLLEIGGIFRREKRALMMIEPPGQARRTRVLEIHDGVLVPVEYTILKRLRSLMRHSRIAEFGLRIDSLAVKPRENRGRRGPVEALIVEEDFYVHSHSVNSGTLVNVRACAENQKGWTQAFRLSR